MIRTIVADDQALVRGGFRMILEATGDIEVVAEAEDGVQALSFAQDLAPDVVLMDIRMPNLDGIEATRRLREGMPAPPKVLMLTTFDTDENVYEALRAGASGFLLKSAPPAQLAAAVRCVHAGEALLAPSITRRLIEEHLRRPTPDPEVAGRVRALTEREQQVLALIGQGRSNIEIADALTVSEATVKTHVNRVFSKLQLRDRVQAVILAYEVGLVRVGQRVAPDAPTQPESTA